MVKTNKNNMETRTFTNVYFASHNKEELIRRMLYDIAQADFPSKKKDFEYVGKYLRNLLIK